MNNSSKENDTSSNDEDTDMNEDLLNLFNSDNNESDFEGFN